MPAGSRPRLAPAVRRASTLLLIAAMLAGLAVAPGLWFALTSAYYVYIDRRNLPDIGPFTRFEFPTIGRIYDVNGRPVIEFAREYRDITPYAEIPAVMREAVLATEDKRFFSHNGVEYLSVPRMVAKVRVLAWARRLVTGGWSETTPGATVFPQGGSTITQQLVRGVFLRRDITPENRYQLQVGGIGTRVLAAIVGVPNVNMLIRKRDELRLALWVEQQMRVTFGSKQRAKEEIFARYVSFVYMGRGQYGLARASQYYFGRPLTSFTSADADLAAVLAGITKSPRTYAPTLGDPSSVLRRRNQILALMAREGFLSPAQLDLARRRPLPVAVPRAPRPFQSSAVVEHVLDELTAAESELGIEDLRQGLIQVHATVDVRVQRIVSEALEQGLAHYERRHPRAAGLVQGSVVVLSNSDGRVLAETGGRQVYQGLATSASDFNRVRRSLRQPGSAMKPFVYLAAFQHGALTLDTLVPDDPISVPNGSAPRKWIANYDGLFKGLIPVRQALAESRNAVAIWLTTQVGIDAVLRTSRSLGVRTPLQRYSTTALGASEVSLLELAAAYRSIAAGLVGDPYVIRQIVRGDDVITGGPGPQVALPVDDRALALIQEGLRGVVRLPTGTAHSLASRGFPIPVMGKTGTTNEFRDALFVGSTYGTTGITVAVRIGFDDNRSLGVGETGGRAALPVFREIMLQAYRTGVVGPVPAFPNHMERRITRYLDGGTISPGMATEPSRLVTGRSPAPAGVARQISLEP